MRGSWLTLAAALALGGCECAQLDPSLTFACESDGGCEQPGRTCVAGRCVLPLPPPDGGGQADAGADAGGGDGGGRGDAGNPDGGCTPTCGTGFCGPIDNGCGGKCPYTPCQPPNVCGGANANVCLPPAICTDGWCWENPLPQGNDLLGLWGSASNDVWAVGAAGTVLHWDGGQWAAVNAGSGDIRAIWGNGPNDVWAAGSDPSGSSGTVMHWAGLTGSAGAELRPEPLYAGTGGADGGVWLAGLQGTVYQGTLFGPWNTIDIGAGPAALRAIWQASDGTVFVGGDDGSGPNAWISVDAGWMVQPAPSISPYAPLYGLTSGRPGATPIACGKAGVFEFTSDWKPLARSPVANLNAVWVSPLGIIWTVGDDSQGSGALGDGRIFRLDGGGLDPFDAGPLWPLRAIWGASDSDIWAVGEAGTMVHYDGNAWSRYSVGDTADLTGISGNSSSNVWAVDSAGGVRHRLDAGWSAPQNVLPTALSAVSVAKAGSIWISSFAGDVLNGDGVGQWTAFSPPGGLEIFSLWATDTDVWVGAKGGPADRFAQSGWHASPLPNTYSVNGIVEIGGSVFAALSLAGGSGMPGVGVLQADGGWNVIPSASDLLAASASAPDDEWAVGANGLAVHFDGGSWAALPTPQAALLLAVWSGGPTNAWTAGASGAVYQFNGAVWKPVLFPSHNAITGVWGNGPDVWTVGDRGGVLHRGP